MTTFDLTTEEGMKAYLRSNLYATCNKVERLPEGYGGFVYRAWQEDSSLSPTIIAKHAAGYAARAQDWKLDQSRLEYEALALTTLSQTPFHHASIRVPRVHHFSREHYTLCLEDLGPLPSLKSYLTPDNSISPSQATAIGTNLGSYLAQIHNITSTNTSLLSQFSTNETARTLSSTLYFSQLPSVASRFGYTGPHIAAAAETAIHDIIHGDEVLTLGDFWTGNVLINPSNLELFVIDLELAKPGTADFDIGQMAAELYFIAAFRDWELGMSVLRTFLKSYRDRREGVVEVGKVAVRVGAHVFVVGGKYWRDSVDEGMFGKALEVADRLLRLGVEGDEEGLRGSVVGELIS